MAGVATTWPPIAAASMNASLSSGNGLDRPVLCKRQGTGGSIYWGAYTSIQKKVMIISLMLKYRLYQFL
jgi:hypothetical protein